jgi:hypothetical protein
VPSSQYEIQIESTNTMNSMEVLSKDIKEVCQAVNVKQTKFKQNLTQNYNITVPNTFLL